MKKKLILICLVIVATLVVCGLAWRRSATSPATLKQHEQAQDYGNRTKQNVANGKAAGDDSPASGQSSYSPPTTSDGISLAVSQSQQQVIVQTKLSGYSDGTCSLKVTNGTQSFEETAQIIYQAQFSTCAGFTIPSAKLPPGHWTFYLDVTSGGTTTSKTTSLEVQ